MTKKDAQILGRFLMNMQSSICQHVPLDESDKEWCDNENKQEEDDFNHLVDLVAKKLGKGKKL